MIPKQYTIEKEGISRTNIKYVMLYNRKKRFVTAIHTIHKMK